MPAIHRGEIYFADLGPITTLPSGEQSIEIAKPRPVIILSIDAINRVSERRPFYVLVMPGTTGAGAFRDRPTNVRLTSAETGLREDGVFLAHQIRSLDMRRLSRRAVGRVSGKALERVESAARYVLGLGS
jgi:mRNA interferase MazF